MVSAIGDYSGMGWADADGVRIRLRLPWLDKSPAETTEWNGKETERLTYLPSSIELNRNHGMH